MEKSRCASACAARRAKTQEREQVQKTRATERVVAGKKGPIMTNNAKQKRPKHAQP